MELAIPDAIQAINSDNPYLCLEGMNHFCRLLSVVEVFDTPKQRRALVDDIVRLFEKIVQNRLYLRFISFLLCVDKPQLQYPALRATTYFAAGPRIASTPLNLIYIHPRCISKNYYLVKDW